MIPNGTPLPWRPDIGSISPCELNEFKGICPNVAACPGLRLINPDPCEDVELWVIEEQKRNLKGVNKW